MDDHTLTFQTIYDDFQPKILRYLTHLVGENDAEDLSQEVFVKVSRALANFKGESKLSTWLYRIATNAALDRLRSLSGQQVALLESLEDSTEKSEAETAEPKTWTGEKPLSVEQQLVRKQMNECIHDYICKLSENYRTVLVLSELEGLKNKEIAEILGITLNTVKIRLHRARTKLKEELEAHCDLYWVEGNEFLPDLRKITQKD